MSQNNLYFFIFPFLSNTFLSIFWLELPKKKENIQCLIISFLTSYTPIIIILSHLFLTINLYNIQYTKRII